MSNRRLSGKSVFVTHQRPDTDAILCIWFCRRFTVLADDEGQHQVRFVRAGERLPEDEHIALRQQGFRVIYLDTGRGKYDQHEKRLGRTSSFELLVKDYGRANDPALKPLIELANATDNIDLVPPTSIHYLFKSLPSFFYVREERDTDWGAMVDFAGDVLDSMYNQWAFQEESRQRFFRENQKYISTNAKGLKFITLMGKAANQREAAFSSGVDVVMFLSHMSGGFQVGVQVNRNNVAVTLERAVAAIRRAEAEKREVNVDGIDLSTIGTIKTIPGWFLHESKKLILCGSRAHPLGPDEVTKLDRKEIEKLLREHVG